MISLHRTLGTTRRVLSQLRHDRRTLVLLLVVPCLMMGLLAWIYSGTPLFDTIGAPLLGIFPFLLMFPVASITTLRERQSGTMERLMTLPLSKGDIIAGYAIAFGLLAAVQGIVTSTFALGVLGLDVAGPTPLLIAVAVIDALLGMSLGLFLSTFASTEFQAVQFLPAVVTPQFLLSGLLVERSDLPGVLEALSNVLPLSYAVDAMRTISSPAGTTGEVFRDMAVVVAFVAAFIAAGAATMRRRTG